MKHYLIPICCLLVACSSNQSEQTEDPKDMYATECYDYDSLDLDSLVMEIFPNTDSFKKEISKIGSRIVFSSYSEDCNVRLFTVDCGGTMCSGTSYVLYRKSDKELKIKKVADIKSDEECGVIVPALYREIHNAENGYKACGVFSFSSTDTVFLDTMLITNEFLDSERFYYDEE